MTRDDDTYRCFSCGRRGGLLFEGDQGIIHFGPCEQHGMATSDAGDGAIARLALDPRNVDRVFLARADDVIADERLELYSAMMDGWPIADPAAHASDADEPSAPAA